MFGFLGFVAIFGSGPSFTTRRAWRRAQLNIGLQGLTLGPQPCIHLGSNFRIGVRGLAWQKGTVFNPKDKI